MFVGQWWPRMLAGCLNRAMQFSSARVFMFVDVSESSHSFVRVTHPWLSRTLFQEFLNLLWNPGPDSHARLVEGTVGAAGCLG